MATPSESGADGDRIGTKRCSSTQGETEIHASLERSDSIAVDGILNRRWKLEELMASIKSGLVILSGGRNKQGGAVLTVTPHDDSDLRPNNLGVLLVYLSRVPSESVQGIGFSIVLDLSDAASHIMQKVLKVLQLTFAEHILHVLVIKPKSFWEKQKTGMSNTFRKAKVSFPVVLLEHPSELFQYIPATDVTMEQGGSLSYDHEMWIEVQKAIEMRQSFLGMYRGDLERLREGLEKEEQASNVADARDVVRRHVEAKQLLNQGDLSVLCGAVNQLVTQYQSLTNPDLLLGLGEIKHQSATLWEMRNRLEQVWIHKGIKLDQVLQLRVYENDVEQILQWLQSEVDRLASQHTDIGEISEDAVEAKTAFEEIMQKRALKYQEVGRVAQMGERLLASDAHYATEVIRTKNTDLQNKWEQFSEQVDARASLLGLSVSFHHQQDEFLTKVESWMSRCITRDEPATIPGCEELIRQHQELKEGFGEAYGSVRRDGHKLIELLRKPIGERSLPVNFLIGSRHVKETLETLYDENNLLEEEWQKKCTHLKMNLNLQKYKEEAKKISTWITDVGNRFLATNSNVGVDVAANQRLLKKHDTFEHETVAVYSSSNQLFKLVDDQIQQGEISKMAVDPEVTALKQMVHAFAGRLDGRREIILCTLEWYQKIELLQSDFRELNRTVPKDKFMEAAILLRPRLQEFVQKHEALNRSMDDITSHHQAIEKKMEAAMLAAKASGTNAEYSEALLVLRQALLKVEDEKKKVELLCVQRESRLNASLDLITLQHDVETHIKEVEAWNQKFKEKEWVPAATIMDAQFQVDTFQNHYNQLHAVNHALLDRGKALCEQTAQLDHALFRAPSSPHVVQTVESLKLQMGNAISCMDNLWRPRLVQTKDCLQYYLLEQRSTKLTLALNTLSSGLMLITGVGRTLSEATSLQQQVVEANNRLQSIHHDVQEFSEEVEECIARNHYQSTAIALMTRSLRDKLTLVLKAMSEKTRMVRAVVEFHNNVEKLMVSIDSYQAQWCSKDTGRGSVSDLQRMLTNMEELKANLQQTKDSVLLQGKSLLEVTSSARRASTSSKDGSPQVPRKNSVTLVVVPSPGPAPIPAHPEEGDAPKVLVSPRYTKTSSSPSETRPLSDQSVVEAILEQLSLRHRQLMELWAARKGRLEQAKRALEFTEAVTRVMEWLDYEGTKCPLGGHEYGRSLEEVQKLIEEHEGFWERNVKVMEQEIDRLAEVYRGLEEGGCTELNQIRTLNAGLLRKWGVFYQDLKTRKDYLRQSMDFHKLILEANTWCRKMSLYVESIDERKEACDTSEEVSRLMEELKAHVEACQGKQKDTLTVLQQICNTLRSNSLVEMVAQATQGTEQVQAEAGQCGAELESRREMLVQIESEKDREMRLKKQRERVVNELLDTERSYVKDLKIVVEQFRPRFCREHLPNTLKGKENIIFCNIQDIEKFHKETLLPMLEEGNQSQEAVGIAFAEGVDKMVEIYVPYCKNKTASEDLVASHRTYLSRFQSVFGTDVPLSSLLIKPVQRITKYPLLLKDALKYTRELGESTGALEKGLAATERVLTMTNNAIHLSLLQKSEELVAELGELLYQGSFLVSEPKGVLKQEKERQLFVFNRAVVLAQKVDLGQARFKYEHKIRIPLSSSTQVNEHLEGDPCKFAILTKDQNRLVSFNLKAPSKEDKNESVKAIRTILLERRGPKSLLNSSLCELSGVGGDSSLQPLDAWSGSTSPTGSPRASRRSMSTEDHAPLGSATTMVFDKYRVMEDHQSQVDETTLVLKKGDIVEVLDSDLPSKWFIRTSWSSSSNSVGWVSPTILERLPVEGSGEEGGPPGRLVHASSMPQLSSGEGKFRFGNAKAFGSHDLQSLQVIRDLKTVTISEEDEVLVDTSVQPVVSSIPPAANKESVSSMDGANGMTESATLRKAAWRRKNAHRHKSRGSTTSMEITADMVTSDEGEDAVGDLPPEEVEKQRKAKEKLDYITQELVDTEKQYVAQLEGCVNGFMKEMKRADLPDALKGKEKLIFGNIQAVYDFHSTIFQNLLEKNKENVENIAKCFLDYASNFEVYVTYCENKPRSESFLWTYQHTGGTFFEEVQKSLGHRLDISSFLIKPVQRITKYQLLLKDMHRSTQKAVMSTPNLEKALQLMQDVPKRANDAMTLSMICGYDGNIHTHGQIILEDEFVVSERGRWVGNKRQLFLLNQRIIITKEKDADGLYLFKDQLKIQNLTLTEKEGDNPCRFGVGTGAINNWEQYYLLEASSPEKKQQWVLAIKDILKQQFELLRALSKPNTKEGFGSPSMSRLLPSSTANMTFSDDSDDSSGCPSPEPVCGRQARSMSTPFAVEHLELKGVHSSPILSRQQDDLYLVEEDCAPAKEDEGILYLYKGQVYKILNRSTHQWWYGRLVRDVVPSRGVPGQAGWIAESFVGKFVGELTQEEVAVARALNTPTSPKKTLKYVASPIRPFNHTFNAGGGGKSKKSDLHTYSTVGSKKSDRLTKLHITNSHNYHEELNERLSSNSPQREKVSVILQHLSDETVIAGRTVHFKCEVTKGVPPPSVVWTKDGLPLNIDRAFCSEGGETCILKITEVGRSDEGTYTCTIKNSNGKDLSSSAKLTVLSAPGPTSRPGVRLLTSTSVSLSWTPPTWDGHSPITMYMMECKEGGDNWSTLMRRVTEPSAVVDDLVPGAEYMFRVVAGNAIGFGEPGPPSDKVRMAKPSSTMEGMFSSDPFEEQYTLLDEIARGQFSVVRECQHNTTQQIYAAKLLPIQIGHSHAQHELQMLSKLAHPNIIQIAAAYMTSDHYILIFQKIQGVNLFDFFIHHNCLSHQTASGSCAQIFDVLSYLHSFKIAHLDIRPENILTIKQPDSLIPTLKVIHFERANHIDQDSSLIVQTMDDYLDYQAPELINGEAATLSTDMWSMGVLIFTLLSGGSPFLVDSQDLTRDNIKSTRYSLSSKYFNDQIKDLISKLLVKDSRKRLTAAECLSHPWVDSKAQQSSEPLNIARLKSHMSSKKWQSPLNAKMRAAAFKT